MTTHLTPDPSRRGHAAAYRAAPFAAAAGEPWPNDAGSAEGGPNPIEIVARYKWRILVFAAILTGFAALVIWSIPPRYAAAAALTIDARQVHMISPEQLLTSQMMDEPQVRTFMEEFADIELARTVVGQLGLNKVPEYCAPPRQAWSWRGWLDRFGNGAATATAPVSCETSVQHAAEQLLKSVSVSNDGKSYVIRIQAEAGNANLAAAIANAYASAYVDDRLAKRRKIAEDASSWLNAYVAKLNGQVLAADAAVARYRSEHHLLPLHGETLVSQSLAEVNSELTALNNDIARKQALVSQLGPNWAGSMTKELQALNARKVMINAQLQELQSRLGQEGDENVELQELLRNVELTRQVYQAALTRTKEIEVDEGIARSDAQVVSEAIAPPYPSYPLKSMMLAGSFAASLGLGAILAFGLSLRSSLFRDGRHLESETGQRLLGVFPRAPERGEPARISLDHPFSLEAECLHKVLVDVLGARPERQGGLGRVVLLTSAAQGEGKTSCGVAIGRSAMQMGLSTLLIDCDMRRPAVVSTLRRSVWSDATSDLERVAPGAGSFEERGLTEGLLVEPELGLHILPLSADGSYTPYLVLGSAKMKQLLLDLRKKYDLILLDTPPVLATIDAFSLTGLADSVILVVEWRRTTRAAVAEAIDVLRRQGAPTAGVVFSKVDLRKYARASGMHEYPGKYDRSHAAGGAARRLSLREPG